MWQHLRFFNALFTSICLALIFNPISSSPVQLYTPSTHQSARRAVNQSKLPIFTRTLFEFEQKFFLSNNGNSSKTGSQDSGKNATTNPATSKAKRHSDLLRRDGEIYTVPLIPTTTDGQPTRYLGEMSIEGPNTDSQVRPIRFKTRFDTVSVLRGYGLHRQNSPVHHQGTNLVAGSSEHLCARDPMRKNQRCDCTSIATTELTIILTD